MTTHSIVVQGVRQLEAFGHEVVALCDYGEARERARAESLMPPSSTFSMPAEPTTLRAAARAEFVGREIGIGFPLVLELTRLGIPGLR